MQYKVWKEFTSYEEVLVEADSPEEARDKAGADWYDLNPEGVSDYHPTGKLFIFDENDEELNLDIGLTKLS